MTSQDRGCERRWGIPFEDDSLTVKNLGYSGRGGERFSSRLQKKHTFLWFRQFYLSLWSLSLPVCADNENSFWGRNAACSREDLQLTKQHYGPSARDFYPKYGWINPLVCSPHSQRVCCSSIYEINTTHTKLRYATFGWTFTGNVKSWCFTFSPDCETFKGTVCN